MSKTTKLLSRLAAAAFFLLCIDAFSQKKQTIILPIKSVLNMKKIGENWQALTPIYQQQKKEICIEAEKASSLLNTSKLSSFPKDKSAHGGRFILNPGELYILFNVIDKGVYALKMRIRINKDFKKFNNKYIDVISSPRSASVTLDKKKLYCEKFKKSSMEWHWATVTAFEVKPGIHKLTISALSGYDFDRIVLSPASQKDFRGDQIPGLGNQNKLNTAAEKTMEEEEGNDIDLDFDEDLADLESDYKAVSPDKMKESQQGVAQHIKAESYMICPLAVEKWNKLTVVGDFKGVLPKYFISVDHGKTWQQQNSNGDLSAIKVKGDGNDTLQVKIKWDPKKTNTIPGLKKIQVTYTSAKADVIAMKGRKLTFRLRKSTLALYDIIDNETGQLISIPIKRNIFSLTLRNSQTKKCISLNNFTFNTTCSKKKNSYIFKFTKQKPAINITCTVTPSSLNNPEWSWQLNVDNKSDNTIEAVKYPVLTYLIGLKRTLIPQSLWSNHGKGIFPGNMSMGFVFSHGAERGIYLAALDKTLVTTELQASGRNGLTTLSATSFRVTQPHHKNTYNYSLACLKPDWHKAADLYRKWAYSWMKRPVFSKWAKMDDGWWTLGSATEAALFNRRATTIFENARWFGLPHMQFWMGCGDGSFIGRMPYLTPRFGTPEMSKKDCALIIKSGGHMGYYVQSREWDAGYYDSEMIGYIPRKLFPETFTVEDYDWSNRNVCNGPWTGKRKGKRIMSPMSKEWRAHIAKHAEDRVNLFGNDTAYFDQMGCTTMTDRNPANGPEYHASGLGYVLMAQEVLEKMRKHNPDIAISQEGMNAATGQYVQFQLASCLSYSDFGKHFLYTFPDSALFHGYSNGVFEQTDGDLHKFMRSRFLFNRFEVPQIDNYVRDLILLRKRIHDWQYNGQFMDNTDSVITVNNKKLPSDRLGYYFSDKELIAKWFLLNSKKEKGILITFQNEPQLSEATITINKIKIPFKLKNKAFLYLINGSVKALDYQNTANSITIKIPPKKVGAILIPGAVKAAYALRTYAFQDIADSEMLHITAVNISPETLNSQWEIVLPKTSKIKLNCLKGNVKLPAYGIYNKIIKIENINKIQKMSDINIKWSFNKNIATSSALITPIIRNASFEIDIDKNNSPDSWWNFNHSFGHILHRFVDNVDLLSLPATLDTSIKHSGTSSVKLTPPPRMALTVDGAFGQKGKPIRFSSSINQYMYHLKPNTKYQISVFAYSDNKQNKKYSKAEGYKNTIKAVANLTANGQSVKESLPTDTWTKLNLEFTTPANIKTVALGLTNASPRGIKVWFDDISLTEMQK